MKRMNRLGVLLALLSVVLLSISVSASAADEYPTRPINVVVPFGAGGITDILARTLASAASPFLSQPLVVVNKPGATGTLAISFVASSKPDGYTLGIAHPSFSLVPYYHKVSYDLTKDFAYIIALCAFKESFSVLADSRWRTLGDLIQYARENPNKVRIAVAGLGGSVNMMIKLVGEKAGVQWTEIPFGSDGEAITALLGGHVDAVGMAGGVFPYARSRKVRILSFSTADRVKEFGEVPTLRELGYDYVAISYCGIVGPKGLPEAVSRKLEDIFKKAREGSAFRETIEKLLLSPQYEVGKEFERKMVEYYKSAGKYVKK